MRQRTYHSDMSGSKTCLLVLFLDTSILPAQTITRTRYLTRPHSSDVYSAKGASYQVIHYILASETRDSLLRAAAMRSSYSITYSGASWSVIQVRLTAALVLRGNTPYTHDLGNILHILKSHVDSISSFIWRLRATIKTALHHVAADRTGYS
ncbi:hypothetical protein F4860DRAFT_45247 [Xylaria cubensis]|nr:hypothetical protein F4860DRAFT_45247 [Xylaria cubensis]